MVYPNIDFLIPNLLFKLFYFIMKFILLYNLYMYSEKILANIGKTMLGIAKPVKMPLYSVSPIFNYSYNSD